MGKIARAEARAGAKIFDKPEPELEPDKNGPAPQHWFKQSNSTLYNRDKDRKNVYCTGTDLRTGLITTYRYLEREQL
jgi:hypothetical protein